MFIFIPLPARLLQLLLNCGCFGSKVVFMVPGVATVLFLTVTFVDLKRMISRYATYST